MKKIALSFIILVSAITCFAQQKLAFPFLGGKDIMTRFFKDSLVVSQDIIQRKNTGLVVLKFSANNQGEIKKTVVYYADDASLVPSVIDALKKSNRKWVIPEPEKIHDFVLPVYIRYNVPEGYSDDLQKAAFNNYRNKRPILPNNQIPLDMATLLPSITISYDILQ